MRFIKAISMGALVLSLSGCGTVVGRINDSEGDMYYKNFQGNFKTLTFQLDGYGYFPAEVFCWASIICPVFSIYSLPVDFAIDTILLPYDFYQAGFSSPFG